MLDGVAMVAEELPALTVARLAALLAETGGLAGARILLVGVGFKIGSPDATETPAEPIARLLRAAGAAPVYCDSQVPALSVDGVPLTRLQPGELRGADLKAAIILGGDRELAFQILRDACAHVLDTGGGRIMGEGLAGVSRL
jgi:UDP-N-acetyl-D-mannosaminuronate dehydrogenase